MDSNTTTSRRQEVIEYLMMNYIEIFELDTVNQAKLQQNLSDMSDVELIYELDVLSEFRAKERWAYQDVLISTIKSSEELERTQEKIEVPIF